MNIIITGAGKGIGLELTAIFAQNMKNKVVAISRNTSQLEKLKADGFSNVVPVAFDLNNISGYPEIIDKYIGPGVMVDILINNAGLLYNKPFLESTPEDIEATFRVNFTAPALLIKALAPIMKKGSHIVNIGSMGGIQGSSKYPGLALYSSSKGAMAILTECLAIELGTMGIACNCLALGAVNTEMLNQAFPGYKAPVGAKEMAAFIAEFALKANKIMNGKIVPLALSNP